MRVRLYIALCIMLISITHPAYGSFNKIVGRLRIGDFLHTKNIFVGTNAHIGGNLTINGTINGKQISDLGSGLTILPPLQENSVARVADTTGNLLKGSTVIIDDSGNISGVNDIALTTISKQGLSGVTVEWPNEVGAIGTVLGITAADQLGYFTPFGSGNVSVALPFFVNNNRITVTDIPNSVTHIRETGITIDNANNITGANTVTANTFNGDLNGNATTATTAGGLNVELAGEVTGLTNDTFVDNIGGITHANIVNYLTDVQNATDMTGGLTLVRRSAAGHFAGNEITAVNFNATNFFNGNLNGNAATATDATNLTTPLGGEVIGVATNNTIDHIDTFDRAAILDHLQTVANATELATPDTLVYRDNSNTVAVGTINATTLNATNFNGGTFNGNLSGNATSADTFNDPLQGNVTGTQNATLVSFVGAQSAANVAAATVLVNGATTSNTLGTIVRRDNTDGGFAAGTITANLTGNVTGNLTGTATNAINATTAVNFSGALGALGGEVTGTQGAAQVQQIAGQGRTAIAAAAAAVAIATSNPTAGTLVLRDGNADFSGRIITATNSFVGNLTGNATTATSATSATNATNALNVTGGFGGGGGDVTGTQSALTVNSVGNGATSAAAIGTATILANSATANNMADTIVLRDNNSHFAVNRITIDDPITQPNDATTKAYVDQVAGAGLSAKTPARVVATANVTITGDPGTIDGVTINNGDRVLLVGQTNTVENGLWLVNTGGAWTRPTDFNSGDPVGQAYVLILEGTQNIGTSWLSSTPLATINTDPIAFSQFSLSDVTQGANVGGGVGQIFRDKTGATLNFKTLTQSNYVVLTNNANTVNIATNGTNLNTANTLVARDGSGNFSAGTITANVTGSASNNVLKSGDTMTGNLEMRSQSDVRFFDADNSDFVGFQAPANVTSYTLDWPATAPAVGQYLQALSGTALQWSTLGGDSATTRAFYVSKDGSDSNSGTFAAPFATLAHAVQEANPIATTLNPVVIYVGAGLFIEDNSGGPITITASGISIVGAARTSTIIQPSTPANNLLLATTANIEITDISFFGGNPLVPAPGAAITINTNNSGVGRLNAILVFSFATGISCIASNGVPIVACENLQMSGNTTSVNVSNMRVIVKDSVFRGPIVAISTPSNSGIVATGANSLITVLSVSFRFFANALSATGTHMRILGCNLESNINGVVAGTGSDVSVVGCNFVFNFINSINIQALNSDLVVTGCHIQCHDSSHVSQGIGIRVTNGARAMISATAIQNADTAIICGDSDDTITTKVEASSVVIEDCTVDIVQNGAARLQFVGGTFENEKVSINDPTSVSIAAFHKHESMNGETTSLAIGTLTDDRFTVYEILNDDEEPLPMLAYEPNFYGYKGTVYRNSSSGEATFNGTHAHDSDSAYYVLTGDNTNKASLYLISDTNHVGSADNVRGWELFKEGTSAGLQFQYRNNDAGQSVRDPYAVMRLNGLDNQVEFPEVTTANPPIHTAARLVWAGDTNLYRSSAGVLRTDGNIAVGGLTAQRVVTTNASKQLVSSSVTDAELTALSGVTSSVQTQLNNKVAKAGDVMTGALEVPIGSAASPAVRFTGSTTTGIFSPTANAFAIAAAGLERLRVSGTGIVTINSLAGAAGVVHSNSSGNLSSSLIVNADVAAGANIADTKLATISTAGKVANSATTATTVNTPNTIVLRDGAGNVNVTVTGYVQTAGDTMTGALTLPAGSPASPSLQFTGSTDTGLSTQTANTVAISTSGAARMTVSDSAITTMAALLLTNIMAHQAIQSVAPVNNGSVSVNVDISLLLLTHNNTIPSYTITFPPTPINGQIFTIVLGTPHQISFTSVGGTGGASIVNPVTNLNPSNSLSATSGGTAVSFIYIQSANAWYRLARG